MSIINYSVVIPVYNAERTLEELTARLTLVFEKTLEEGFEIIFVDDHSKDNSWYLLTKLAASDKRVKAIKLKKNFGQHDATLCGLTFTKGSFILTLDDDLQHSPEAIPSLINCLQETGAEVVIAKLADKRQAKYRIRASNLMRRLSEWLIKKPKGLHLSSFRLLTRDVVRGMVSLQLPFVYLPALIFFVTKNVTNKEVTHRERKHGSSNYNLFKMTKLASRLLLNSSLVRAFFRKKGNQKSIYIIEKALNVEGF